MPLRETLVHQIERGNARPVDRVEILQDGALTAEQAHQQFGLSASAWRRLAKTGALPSTGDGKLLIPRRAIVLYLADRLRLRRDLVEVPPRRRGRPRKAAA
jgi:hypothetical protein